MADSQVSSPLEASLCIPSPIGWVEICGTAAGITAVTFRDEETAATADPPQPLLDCAAQLREYFAGERKVFDLPLIPQGTEFQQMVWNSLLGLNFGQTRSYADIAYALRKPKAIRAVGTANGANPIAVIVPCHRVIGSSGKLTGYAGGLDRKQWLLEHERALTSGKQASLF